MKLDRTKVFASVWGFAEATVFFIVPDVLLGWVALQSYKRALVACLWVLGGALVGGCVTWFTGSANPESLRTLFASMPAINDAMIANVALQLEQDGLTALFIGPLIGAPYKIYALEAANSDFSLAMFLMISIPARMIRFVLVTSVTAAMSHFMQRVFSLRVLRASLVVFWVAFYAWFFQVMA